MDSRGLRSAVLCIAASAACGDSTKVAADHSTPVAATEFSLAVAGRGSVTVPDANVACASDLPLEYREDAGVSKECGVFAWGANSSPLRVVATAPAGSELCGWRIGETRTRWNGVNSEAVVPPDRGRRTLVCAMFAEARSVTSGPSVDAGPHDAGVESDASPDTGLDSGSAGSSGVIDPDSPGPFSSCAIATLYGCP